MTESTPNDVDAAIGQRLRDLRMRIGLRQSDLATPLGVQDPAAVGKYESGKRTLTLRLL